MIKTYKTNEVDYILNVPDVLKTSDEINAYIKNDLIKILNSKCKIEIEQIVHEEKAKTLAIDSLLNNKSVPQEWLDWKAQRDTIVNKYQVLKDSLPDSF